MPLHSIASAIVTDGVENDGQNRSADKNDRTASGPLLSFFRLLRAFRSIVIHSCITTVYDSVS